MPSLGRASREGSCFDKSLIDRLGSIVTGTRRVVRNARLFREQQNLASLYVVRFGQFKLVGDDSNGQQCVVGLLMPGDWIGLNAIATGRHEFGVLALEDSEVLEIPFNPSHEMTPSQMTMQQQILKVVSEALNIKCRETMNVRVSLDCRFARFLLKLGEKYSQLGYSQKTFRLSMSRSDLGNFLGSTCESMSRVVARFNASAIVTIRGRNVDVHDWKALEDLSNGVRPSAPRSLVH
jgi:CRP/FNR family transcriptional regulator